MMLDVGMLSQQPSGKQLEGMLDRPGIRRFDASIRLGYPAAWGACS